MTISLYANDVLKTEIDHLLNYLKNQKGEFIRNGKSHTPEKAVEHIIKKYNHHKKEITTTEKFIELCASKSILSGKPYEYKNEKGESTEVSALLTKALKEFRDPPKK